MKQIAIIETGGKQYKVSNGDKIKIEKIRGNEGDKCEFDKVLLVSNGKEIKIGNPYVAGAKVDGIILNQARDKEKIVFRYHSKTRYRKFKTHRQYFTQVAIKNISF
ncbi:MAG: 50S ribosomal protein L21 [Minisyncoccia bacterium]